MMNHSIQHHQSINPKFPSAILYLNFLSKINQIFQFEKNKNKDYSRFIFFPSSKFAINLRYFLIFFFFPNAENQNKLIKC